MLVGFIACILVFCAYQNSKAEDELTPVQVESFAGVEIHSQEEANKLADEIEKEMFGKE